MIPDDVCADFIETYSGRKVQPWAPNPALMCILDIAHALSQECRWNGHIAPFYSVAQHSCIIADFCEKRGAPPIDCLRALMHDSPEAYLKDIPRPLKRRMPIYREWEAANIAAIYTWLQLDDPMPSWLKDIDSRILLDERDQLMATQTGIDYGFSFGPLGVGPIEPWLQPRAEQEFLIRYAKHAQTIYGRHQYLRSGWGVAMGCTFKDFPFRTFGGDVPQDSGPSAISDLLEVDIRGNVGRVALRSENGMMIRDTKAGSFPRPAWRFMHGQFELVTP